MLQAQGMARQTKISPGLKPPVSTGESAVARLCPACGLCCNGVLFRDVELLAGDDRQRLAELGLPLKRAGAKLKFPQPCACLEGTLCRIYAERPARCRAFECRVLKRVQAGELAPDAALKIIRRMLRLAGEVRGLLQRLAPEGEGLPLTRRYARLMAQPIDLSRGAEEAEARGELMLAVHELMSLAQREFLVESVKT